MLETGVVIRHAACVLPGGISHEPLSMAGGYFCTTPAPGALELDLRDHLLFTGLVNAHDHLQLNCFPPYSGTEPFPNSYAWIEAFQEVMATPEVAKARAIPIANRLWQGGLKNLLCGATTVAHHDPSHPILEDAAFPVRVVRHFGWSHSLGLGMPDGARSLLTYGPPVTESFAATPPEQPWLIHLAEGTDAIAASELAKLDALSCLAANTVLIHGVGLTDADIDRLLAQGAAVVWCPTSNLNMLGTTIQPRRLLDAGRLALGTDSRLTGAFDLLEEMRRAKTQGSLSGEEILSLTTEAGGRLLRMPDIGGFEPGQQADLLIVRASRADPYETLLGLHRGDIRAVVRGGKPAIADPDFVAWFAAAGISAASIRLDGRPKLCATALLGPPGAAELEPGLEVLEELDAGTARP